MRIRGQTYVTVTFSEPGLYSFDSLDVVCQPMGSFDERVDALKASTVDDLEFGVNEITGTIALDSEKLFSSSASPTLTGGARRSMVNPLRSIGRTRASWPFATSTRGFTTSD